MNLEIHKPELVQRVNAHIRTGRFHDADELIEKALDALDEQATAAAPATATAAVVLAALQARPYPDTDLTPPRVRLTNVRDVVLRWRGCSIPISCRKGGSPDRNRELLPSITRDPLARCTSAWSASLKFASALSFSKL